MYRRVVAGIILCLGTTVGLVVLNHTSTAPPQVPTEPAAEVCDPPWFVDVTDQVGLNFVHDPGPVGSYFFPQIVGSGGAVFDYDNDGRLDIYLVQNAGPNSPSTNRLFHQESDGRFTDVTASSGLGISGYGMGVAVADVNNDGWPDILVTEFGRIRLFRNNGNGTFTDVTREAGLDDPLWATSAAFFDYDRDGWLDLVVVNYVDYDPSITCTVSSGKKVFCGPKSFRGTVAKLFHNLGGKPGTPPGAIRFEDVTLVSGFGQLTGPALGVLCADFNGDHWPDVLVANDGKPNHLWINQKDGTFKDEAIMRGLATNRMGQPEANMGIAMGEVTGDGYFDIFVTHLTEETNTLWKQGPRGAFEDRTVAAGIPAARWRATGFGVILADFDHDGALDLAIANGRVSEPRSASKPSGDSFWAPYQERNQLFVNDGKGRFRDISHLNEPFCGSAAVSRGLVCGDFDNDGAVDLLVTAIGGRARLFRNVAPRKGHWLTVRAVDPRLHRDAYGAEVTVQAGGRKWFRLVNPGYSCLSSNDVRAHYGLGPTEQIDRIHVLWPDGLEETFAGGPVDRFIELRRGEGKK